MGRNEREQGVIVLVFISIVAVAQFPDCHTTFDWQDDVNSVLSGQLPPPSVGASCEKDILK